MKNTIQTYSGLFVNPLAMTPDEITLKDIAHALSLICRFGGHCTQFYSVAQHSVLVSEITKQLGGTPDQVYAALLHDATEAYLIDLPRPIKNQLPDYKTAEKGLEKIIAEKFKVVLDDEIIKKADMIALAMEADVLMVKSQLWDSLQGITRLNIPIKPLNPNEACLLFLSAEQTLKSHL